MKLYTAVLFALLFVACSCSLSLNTEPRRPAEQQFGATIKITTVCYVVDPVLGNVNMGGGMGTGVLVSDDLILTAYHVVDCGILSSKIMVDPGDGVLREAYVEVLLPTRDITRLKLAPEAKSLKEFMTPVTIAPRPQIGDKICMSTAVPRWGYFCGTVQPNKGSGLYFFDRFTEFGNSGSGVYHNGKLVGLLDILVKCQEKVPCLGGITPLQGYEWLVP
jgi:hypothetical protein